MEIKSAETQALLERRSAIATEIESDGADLDALETEVREINAELETRKAAEAKKVEIRTAIANGEGTIIDSKKEEEKKMTPIEERSAALVENGKYSIPTEEIRSTLISGATVATPTGVSGINDIVGNGGSILDFIKVVNCEGMGSNKVAYIAADAAEAGTQTEGSEAANKEATFGYVTINPTNVAMYSQISKQVKKQSPLQYEAKVTEQAVKSLRKKLVSIVAGKMGTSTLVDSVAATQNASNKGVVDEKTLRKLVLAYGGDDSVAGGAMLFLNKTDLVAFGDVRGTNEKLPVYEVIPDGSNPNTGVIKDGGLSVRYCLCSALTACAGTAKSTSDIPTMFYGNPMNCELDLFSAAEVRVSEDFAFTSLMDTIVGDVEAGADVVAKGGFVTLAIKA